MQQRNNRHHAHLSRAETEANVGNNQHQRYQKRQDRRFNNALTPACLNGRNGKVGRGKSQFIGYIGNSSVSLGGIGCGKTNQEAILTIGAGSLNNRIRLTRLLKRIANFIGSCTRRLVDRNAGAANKLGTKVKAAHAAYYKRCHNAARCNNKQHLASTHERNVALDKAANHLLSRGLRFVFHQLFRTTNCIHAVAYVPEIGVLFNSARSHQTNERRLENKHHNNVTENTQGKRHTKAFNRGTCQEEQRQRGNKRY